MTTQRVLGKCEPESDALEAAAERGFDSVELYLNRDHLDNMERSATACREASVDVAVLHTPHVQPSELDYFEKTDELAQTVGAEYVVVHSEGVSLNRAPSIEEQIDWETPHGYESDPGESLYYIENVVLDQDLEFVLDIAHVSMATSAFRRTLRTLLTQPHCDQIQHVHISDATNLEDDLGYGDGELDLSWVIQQVKREHNGLVTLEVPQEDQEDLLNVWENLTK